MDGLHSPRRFIWRHSRVGLSRTIVTFSEAYLVMADLSISQENHQAA